MDELNESVLFVSLSADAAKRIVHQRRKLRLALMQCHFQFLSAFLLAAFALLCLTADWSLLYDLRVPLYADLNGVVPQDKIWHLTSTSLQGICCIFALDFARRLLGERGAWIIAMVAGLMAFLFVFGLSQVAGCVELPQLMKLAVPAVSILLGGAPQASQVSCGPIQELAAWFLVCPWIGLPLIAVLAGEQAWVNYRSAYESILRWREWRLMEREERSLQQKFKDVACRVPDLNDGVAHRRLGAALRDHLDATLGSQVRAWRAMLQDGSVVVMPKERQRITDLIAGAEKYLTSEFQAEVMKNWKAAQAEGGTS